MKSIINTICIMALLIVAFDTDWSVVNLDTEKADTVCVIYESSETLPEPYVTGALFKLKAEGLETRIFDKDIVTGEGKAPESLEKAIDAAINNGLPAIVVLSRGKVIDVVNLPKTESEIIEAVK